MAEQLDEAPDESPQWLQDYQRPVEDTIDLSSSPSQSRGEGIVDLSSSPERDSSSNLLRRRKFQLSESEPDPDEDEQEGGSPKRCEEEYIPENVVEGEEMLPEHHGNDAELTDKLEEADEASRKPETGEKKVKNKLSSSLPLVFSDKILRSKVLLECEGDSLDVSGDMGAVGRVSVSEKSEVLLDLKGTIYKTNIVPSNSFFLVNIGTSEAKVEAIINDFVQLVPDTHNNNVETMIEGTLEGMTFDSEDEGMNVTIPRSGVEVTEDGNKVVKKAKATKTATAASKPSKPSKGANITTRKPSKRSSTKINSSKRAAKKSK